MATIKRTRSGKSYFMIERKMLEMLDEFVCECDSCSCGIEIGYLVPSQEALYCRRCFIGWQERSHLQGVDKALECRNIELYSELFELHKERQYA